MIGGEGGTFTSAIVESYQQFSPKSVFGNKLRIEFRGTIPAIPGAFPALWLLGAVVKKLHMILSDISVL